MPQGVLTVVTEIVPERIDALVALLDELDRALYDQGAAPPIVDFRVLDSVHFARFVVLPANSEGKRHLVFSTAYDGPRSVHVTELGKLGASGLCTIYGHCVGFPAAAMGATATLLAYLEKSSIRYGAMHVGYVGRAVADIRGEEALREFIQERLDAARAKGSPEDFRSARVVRKRIVAWVQESDFRWALGPRAEPIARSGVENWWTHPLVVALTVLGLIGGGVVAFTFGNLIGLFAYAGHRSGGARGSSSSCFACMRSASRPSPTRTWRGDSSTRRTKISRSAIS